MKIVKIVIAAVILLLAGGFIYLGVMDVPVQKSEITKTIPNDQFYQDR